MQLCVCGSDSWIHCCYSGHHWAHFESFQFQFHTFSPVILEILTLSVFHVPAYLAVVIGHREKGYGAVGVAAVTDRGHVSVPHDWHGGQRLARGVRMWNGVALPGRRGQLGAQCQVLLDLLILGLVKMELGVLQVAVYLQRNQIIRTFYEQTVKLFVTLGSEHFSSQH